MTNQTLTEITPEIQQRLAVALNNLTQLLDDRIADTYSGVDRLVLESCKDEAAQLKKLIGVSDE